MVYHRYSGKAQYHKKQMEISRERTSAEYKVRYGRYDSRELQNFITRLDRDISKYAPIKSRFVTALSPAPTYCVI